MFRHPWAWGTVEWHLLTHSILINLFINLELNNFLLLPLLSIVFVQEVSVVFRKVDNKKEAYLLVLFVLTDSIQPMLGTCQNEVNYHWFSCDSWRPKRARHVWGRSVKCLGLIAGVSFARLTPSLCSLFFALPPSFVPFAYVFGKFKAFSTLEIRVHFPQQHYTSRVCSSIKVKSNLKAILNFAVETRCLCLWFGLLTGGSNGDAHGKINIESFWLDLLVFCAPRYANVTQADCFLFCIILCH